MKVRRRRSSVRAALHRLRCQDGGVLGLRLCSARRLLLLDVFKPQLELLLTSIIAGLMMQPTSKKSARSPTVLSRARVTALAPDRSNLRNRLGNKKVA